MPGIALEHERLPGVLRELQGRRCEVPERIPVKPSTTASRSVTARSANAKPKTIQGTRFEVSGVTGRPVGSVGSGGSGGTGLSRCVFFFPTFKARG
jgi:hypothetical protein